ncbi:MAG TPA: MFS transporter, partial [Streptosporangiaceae bacterium]|nr:MFS transporter [Streptosporangiaceae bacterium]
GSKIIESAIRAAFVTGLDRISWVAAGIAAAGAVASAILLRPRGISSAPAVSAAEPEPTLRRAA